MVSDAIYTRLSGFSGLTSIVSTNIWRDAFPESASFPGLVFSIVQGESFSDLQGSAKLARSVVQIDCFAADSTVVDSAAEQVRLALQGYGGSLGGSVINVVAVGQLRTYYEPQNEVSLFRASRQYIVVHDEA